MDYKEKRDEELYAAFLKAYANPRTTFQQAVTLAVNSRCSRHWVSANYFYRVILGWDRGYIPYPKIRTVRKQREDVYIHLYKIYIRIRNSREFCGYSRMFLASMAVNSPANSFYLTDKYAMRIIRQQRKHHAKL